MISEAVQLNERIWESPGPRGLKQLQDNEMHLVWSILIRERILVLQDIIYLSQMLEKRYHKYIFKNPLKCGLALVIHNLVTFFSRQFSC